MTIIVAVHKNGITAVAADTQTTFGSFRVLPENQETPKLQRIGDSIISFAGWGMYENILDDYIDRLEIPPTLNDSRSIFVFFTGLWKELHETYNFVNDQCQNDDSPFGDLDASFMVVTPGVIYHVASDMSVTSFKQYFSIGSGSAFGMGALHALYGTGLNSAELAKKAVEAAMAFDVKCGGRIETVILDGSSR